jgi:BirA family biotin operon repressor/biotin-[acetyl-CoA-carboxylase] ligase
LQNNTFSTLFVGQNLIKLLAVDSTNNFLKELLSKSEPLPEGTVIMADEQFSGRGQQQNSWQAEPGKNLTISLFLKPNFISLSQQFYLNMTISLAIYYTLAKHLPDHLSIKWPNDIYYKNQKIGGVLIENTVFGRHFKHTVIGIGLNINQQHFEGHLQQKATSMFQILNKAFNLEQLLSALCSQIESLYLQLKSKKYTNLQQTYVSKLYQLERPSIYRQNGEIFEGIIKGITETGLLQLERNGKIEHYNFKEIEFLTQIQ